MKRKREKEMSIADLLKELIAENKTLTVEYERLMITVQRLQKELQQLKGEKKAATDTE